MHLHGGSRSVAVVADFVRKHALANVVQYTAETHNLVFGHAGGARSDARLVVVASEEDFEVSVNAIVAAHAKAHMARAKGPHLLHVTVVPSERLMLGVLGIVDGFQRDANQPPMAVILNTTSFATYGMAQKLTARSLGAFVLAFLAGAVSPTMRSQPKIALVAPQQRAHGVTEIAGEQYPELVVAPPHDVLVWMYQPWCAADARCASFAATYRSFGHFVAQLANSSKYVNIDADGNDVDVHIGNAPQLDSYKMGLSRNSAPHLPSRGAMAASSGVLALYTGEAPARLRPFFFPTDGAHSVDALATFLFKHSRWLQAPLPKAERFLANWDERADWDAYDPPQITAVFCSKIKKVARLHQNGVEFESVQPGQRLLVTTFHGHNWTAEVKGKVVHSWRMNFDRGPRQKLVISKQKKNKKKSNRRG